MLDYIIVGSGIAGLCFAEIALEAGKKVLLFENDSLHTSATAAGVYNPIILKRYSVLSDAQEQLNVSRAFFSSVQNRLGVNLLTDIPVLRRFSSISEQNDWFQAMDKPGATPFMSNKLVPNSNAQIEASFGFGEVLQTGFVDTAKFVDTLRADYIKSGHLIKETFAYKWLELTNDSFAYKNFTAKKIVFAEGFGINHNPFFDVLPLAGTKGEILTVKIKNLAVKEIIKAGVFILPLGNDVYRIGSTYEWNDKTENPTEAAKEQLLQSLSELTKLPVELVDHLAGIRPTTTDRKPIIGSHPKHQNMNVLNGLGTRGVMLGPYCANQLFNYIESGIEINPQMDIARFSGLFAS
ncbi:NAD(P)/FAD-dependent oxidoreductase [Flavobacterium silvaticum]|uniref:FAD-binding oxidoreductase n=1 Tax=Flavobacterium silvaticum TaxID=1852020 RepID=A0A972FK90_9FLAO|nr:FAD-dependent oxidoreductase [Flavobacterium silvaticum]NMH27579.1 FAD-binding oxidoreductase [Flavobacterium silvaticum]